MRNMRCRGCGEVGEGDEALAKGGPSNLVQSSRWVWGRTAMDLYSWVDV